MVRKMEVAAVLALVVAGSAFGQEREQPARTKAQPGSTAQGTQQQVDAAVANCLILGNQAEIALAKYAIEQTKDDQVKELAQTLVEDHQKFIEKLRPFASKGQSFELRTAGTKSNIRQVGGTDEDRTATDRNATERPRTTAGSRTSQGGTLADRLFAIEHQKTEECLKLSMETLSKYKGQEFDQAFLGQQISMHINMLGQLKGAEGQVSEELSELLKTGQKTAKEHKQHAEKLVNNSGSKSRS